MVVKSRALDLSSVSYVYSLGLDFNILLKSIWEFAGQLLTCSANLLTAALNIQFDHKIWYLYSTQLYKRSILYAHYTIYSILKL